MLALSLPMGQKQHPQIADPSGDLLKIVVQKSLKKGRPGKSLLIRFPQTFVNFGGFGCRYWEPFWKLFLGSSQHEKRARAFNEKARCVSLVLACSGVDLGPLGGQACAAEAWLGGLSGTFGDARKRWRTPPVSAILGADLSAPESQK